MKIVYYNWVDFDDPLKRGGGVTVYQKNLISTKSELIDAYSISAGVYYGLFRKKCFWKRIGKKYRIYNSDALAPAYMSFGQDSQLDGKDVSKVFLEIIENIGNVSIIHFNNLEGIPVSILSKLKKKFPNIKIVFSLHNYYPFCPQVNLWFKEQKSCISYNEGKSCIQCGFINRDINYEKRKMAVQTFILDRNLSPFLVNQIRKVVSFIRTIKRKLYFKKKVVYSASVESKLVDTSLYFFDRRKKMINEINTNVDIILSVSERVKAIGQTYGLSSNRIKNLYIGTIFSSLHNEKKFKKGRVKSIGYLGYMRLDKGFYFFLDCLEQLDRSLAGNLHLIVAAKNTDHNGFSRLKALEGKFKSFSYYDGYDGDNISEIYEKIDLMIVPVLWEDNLPQVAIESNCFNTPIFTSDRGGAREVHGCNDMFTFNAGSISSFNNKLTTILTQGISNENYWDKVKKPKSVQEHQDEMIESVYTELLR